MHTATKTRVRPTEIAEDTFLIHDHEGEGKAPVLIPLNSMVIRGAQPVVVDTGTEENRDRYLEDVFGLVDPEDIRWVVISHDDIDHTGNVNALMAAAPNATLVVNWFMTERMGSTLQVPPTRQLWLQPGDSLDVGDRVLQTVRPPIFDSPTTRGVFDPTTGVYWGSDAFASPILDPSTPDVTGVDQDFWAEGIATFAQYVSPWLELVDDEKFQLTVDRIEALDPKVIVGCHTEMIPTSHVARAIAATRNAPYAEVQPQPDAAMLEEIQRALSGDLAAA